MKKITKFDIDTAELIADAIERFDWSTNKCNNIGEFCEVLIWGGTKQAPTAYKKGYEGIVYSVLSEAGMDPDKDIHAIDNVIRDINKDVADAAVVLYKELYNSLGATWRSRKDMKFDGAAELVKIPVSGRFSRVEKAFGKIDADIKSVVDFKRLGAHYFEAFKSPWRIGGMFGEEDTYYYDSDCEKILTSLVDEASKKYGK